MYVNMSLWSMGRSVWYIPRIGRFHLMEGGRSTIAFQFLFGTTGPQRKMPGNVEIKARLQDVEGIHKISSELSQSSGETLIQEDVFFFTTNGRLKLRTIKDVRSELIFYDRPDKTGPKFSDYSKTEVANPESLKETLRQALGIKGIVRKVRKLYMVDQTRVHIDNVEGLGNFMELEVMMKDGQTAEEGQKIAEDLMEKLGVKQSDLLSGAYMDMILQKSEAA